MAYYCLVMKPARFYFNIFIVLDIFLSLSGCANIVAPKGGKKDVDAPQIRRAYPEPYSTNVGSKKITLEFNEFINLKDPENQIIISPEPKTKPEIKLRGKQISIDLKDELLPNTTYTINFGESISDYTENNIAFDLQYVFSTGLEIDSLSLSGSVKNILSGKPIKNAFALLYKNTNDSVIYKQKPDYVARTNSEGLFNFRNLQENVYKLMVIEETNNDKIYNSTDESIGFYDTLITLKKNIILNTVFLFKQLPDITKVIDKSYQNKLVKIVFNKPTINLNATFLGNEDLASKSIFNLNKSKDTLIVYTPFDTDSLTIKVSDENYFSDTVKVKRTKKSTESSFSITIPKKVSPGNFVSLNSNYPLFITEMKDSVFLVTDSIKINVYKNLKKDLENPNRMLVDYPLKPGNYKLVLADSLLKNIFNSFNPFCSFDFIVPEPESYGNLTLKIKGRIDKNYIAELLNESEVVVSTNYLQGQKEITYNFLEPGPYKLRVIADNNANKKWDTGNYLKHQQPEFIYYYPNEIELRPNWDLDIEYILP